MAKLLPIETVEAGVLLGNFEKGERFPLPSTVITGDNLIQALNDQARIKGYDTVGVPDPRGDEPYLYTNRKKKTPRYSPTQPTLNR
jgi:hypothetical protein